MGCFEKIFGTFLGLLIIALGVYFIINPEPQYSTADNWFFIVGGAIWIVMNLCTNYEDFESEFWQIFQSPVSIITGKWIILSIASSIVSYFLVGFFFGFDSYQLWSFSSFFGTDAEEISCLMY